jgi:hypothetical protein
MHVTIPVKRNQNRREESKCSPGLLQQHVTNPETESYTQIVAGETIDLRILTLIGSWQHENEEKDTYLCNHRQKLSTSAYRKPRIPSTNDSRTTKIAWFANVAPLEIQ